MDGRVHGHSAIPPSCPILRLIHHRLSHRYHSPDLHRYRSLHYRRSPFQYRYRHLPCCPFHCHGYRHYSCPCHRLVFLSLSHRLGRSCAHCCAVACPGRVDRSGRWRPGQVAPCNPGTLRVAARMFFFCVHGETPFLVVHPVFGLPYTEGCPQRDGRCKTDGQMPLVWPRAPVSHARFSRLGADTICL